MRKGFNSRPEKKKKKQGKDLNVSELQTPSLTMMHLRKCSNHDAWRTYNNYL